MITSASGFAQNAGNALEFDGSDVVVIIETHPGYFGDSIRARGNFLNFVVVA